MTIQTKIIFSLLLFISFTSTAQKEIGVWDIQKGVLLTNEDYDNQLAEKYWEVVTHTLPNDLLETYVSSFKLFTDGKEEDLGGINPMNELNSKWQVDLDITDMNIASKDSTHILSYTHTLIHEYGHLLTLNSNQVMPTEDLYQDDTKGYLTSEGYATKKSYLGQFVQQFWSPTLLHQWDRIDRKRNQRKRLRHLYRFYMNYMQSFVTDYAAESPEEDIAEAWTFFVLCDAPKAAGIKEKKILFFYQFPELIERRAFIRSKVQHIPLDYLNNFKSSK